MRLLLLSKPESARENLFAFSREARGAPDIGGAEVLNLDLGDVDQHVKQQASDPARFLIPFDRETVRKRIKASPATELELVLCQANLIQTRLDPARAEPYLYRAQAIAPKDPRVLEAWARQEVRQHNESRAAVLYREAVEAGSTNPKALLQSARIRLNEAAGTGGDIPGGSGLAATEAAAEIRRAVAINPGDGEAYSLLGRALFVQEKIAESDLVGLDPGLNAPRQGTWVRYYRALLLMRLGQHAASVNDIRLVAENESTQASVRQAMLTSYINLRIASVEKKVSLFIRQGQHDQALAFIDEMLSPSLWPTAEKSRESLREWVGASAALEKIKNLAEAGKMEELRAAETKFIEQFPKQPASAQFRQHLQQIAK